VADTVNMLKAVLNILLSSILFLGVIHFSGVAHAQDSKEIENKAYWLCKNKGEVRTIRVQVDDHGSCLTFYSKAGSEKVVGTNRNREACMNFLNNIKTNLEKSSWNCRDISDTKTTAALD
jgi:hypothetical protein